MVRLPLPFVPAYRAAIDPWAALGDPTRKAIFERLVDGPRAVVELASELPVSRPAVSQHLRVLKDAGLVTDRAVGTRRIYRVAPDGLALLRADLEDPGRIQGGCGAINRGGHMNRETPDNRKADLTASGGDGGARA